METQATEAETNPFNEGWKAFEAGLGRYDFPGYVSFSDECQWVDGWDFVKLAQDEKSK